MNIALTLTEIEAQISALQKQAAEIKGREFETAIADIRAKMAAYGVTVNDLKSSKGSARSNATPVAAKYKGPNGEVWSGRGLKPKWISALLAAGHKVEEYAIADQKQ